ncbi:MAG: class I SAM-dependent methyltransferase [Candidatus Heimdallarchaeota archaeon]|nr:MAG: class I SAM-dependent methyltransferase [Candidatus Heimdallarchaeota archaeon]
MEEKKENTFTSLFDDAKAVDIRGWDFSYVKERMTSEPLPWDYRKIILPYVKKANCMLDMGTGGGEFLSSLDPLPKVTFATEAYPPNIPIAKETLDGYNVKLVPVTQHEKLPLPDDFFDLIINRHEYYCPEEIYRILKPQGIFITQQVGRLNNIELNRFFGDVSYKDWEWDLKYASQQLKTNGFSILNSEEATINEYFRDIGAVVFYLRIISWQIPNFNIDENIKKFKELHSIIQKDGLFKTHAHRFLIIVKKE